MPTQLPSVVCAALALFAALPSAWADAGAYSASLRALRTVRSAADTGPVAQANAVQPGTARAAPSSQTVLAELQGDWLVHGLTLHGATALAWRSSDTDPVGTTEGRITEAFAAGALGGWHWTLGKKVVAWDVGYAFRPNDVVQHEARRALAAEPLEGRGLVMAEHFNAETAWSIVAVNPLEGAHAQGERERALALRVYTRQGGVDGHGFMRQGERTGTSLGAAVSWVADDALELHASARVFQRASTLVNRVQGAALATTNPWQATEIAGHQWLVGGTWTADTGLSLLVEAWHDATALSDAQWDAWLQRNRSLPTWLERGAPAAAVAGNLAWQTQALGASSSLRRDNLFVRMSWQDARWNSALDLLYTPADRGLLATASLVWTGEQVRLEAGLRASAGAADALQRQLPVQRQAYLLASWAL